MRPECETLTGRMRDICNGTAEGVTTAQCESYRKMWGLPSLSGYQCEPITPKTNYVSSLPPNKPKAPPASGPGTNLKELFAGWQRFFGIEAEPELNAETLNDVAAAGVASCVGCKGLESMMNRLGPDECERQIEDIVAKVKGNAAKHKVARLGITADQLPLFEFTIRRLVLRAIRQARNLSLGN